MSRQWWSAVVGLLFMAVPVQSQTAQSVNEVELAAARAMIQRSDIPKGMIAIEPEFAMQGDAPGTTHPSRIRSHGRNSTLVAGLGAGRVARLSEVRRCPRCLLSDVSVILTLSEPHIKGETAVITVTAKYNGSREQVEYETVQFTLGYTGGKWTVVKARQVGVS